MANDGGEDIAGFLGVIFVVIAAIVAIALAIAGTIVVLSIGGVVGGAHAVKNYYDSLRDKLKLERP